MLLSIIYLELNFLVLFETLFKFPDELEKILLVLFRNLNSSETVLCFRNMIDFDLRLQ